MRVHAAARLHLRHGVQKRLRPANLGTGGLTCFLNVLTAVMRIDRVCVPCRAASLEDRHGFYAHLITTLRPLKHLPAFSQLSKRLARIARAHDDHSIHALDALDLGTDTAFQNSEHCRFCWHKAFHHHSHRAGLAPPQVALCNKGDIDATFRLVPPETAVGKRFSFQPQSGTLRVGESLNIHVRFCCEVLGAFSNRFSWRIDGCLEDLTLDVKGNMVSVASRRSARKAEHVFKCLRPFFWCRSFAGSRFSKDEKRPARKGQDVSSQNESDEEI